MTDTGQDIVIGDNIDKTVLVRLSRELQGRLLIVEIQGDLAHIRYRNYYKTTAGNRSKDANGAWKLLELIDKWVVLT